MTTFNKWASAFVAVALTATLAPTALAATPEEKTVAKAPVSAYSQDTLLVKVKAGKQKQAVVEKHGAKVKAKLGQSEWQVVQVPSGQAASYYEKLKNDGDVEAVEFDSVMTMNLIPNDPQYPNQWYLPKVSAPQAWDITTGSSQRTIAIVDTGVDLNHNDIKNKIVAGYDFVNNDTVAQDDQGHGTHVAGVAAASTNNALDVAGTDWNARIMPVKVLNSSGAGTTAAIINGIYWAADNGAHVINLSLGGGSYSQAFQDAINYAYNKNVIIVAAAGNSASSAAQYPAAYANVVAVGATTSTDGLSTSSNFGSWVDLAAPGQSIVNLKMGGGTVTFSGSSMAAPLVAGAMTLTWSKRLTATNATIINRVLSTCDPITGTGTSFQWGRLNLYRAVNGF